MSAFILASLLALATPLPAAAQEVHEFNVTAEDPASAIRMFGVQAGIQILASADDLKGKKFNPVSGDISTEDGLNGLLAGTGLSHRYVGDRAVALVDNRAAAENQSGGDSSAKEGKKSSSDAFRVAQVDQGSSSQAAVEITEIVVTAEKRAERIQDVPVPMTAIDANTLAERGQGRLQDYFATVPGLNLAASGGAVGGSQTLAIRGITTGGLGYNPTVAISIDDVPYGSGSALGFGNVMYPDIDPGDLARIEVLRGPQGTLYGASSIGGLIKFVTVDPSTDGLSGRMQVLGEQVDHGGSGYGARGSINIPISDTVAIRASVSARRDPGYIENITTGQRNVNQVDSEGGRFAALWRPSEDFSIKFAALLQNSNGQGSPAVDTNILLQPVLGDLKQAFLPGTQTFRSQARLYTATLTGKLGSIDLTSISGYSVNTFSETQDFTGNSGGLAQAYYNVGAASEPNLWETKKFTQEFRLSSQHGQTLEWLAGLFYTHENSPVNQELIANDAATGAPVGSLINFAEPFTLTEYAAYADLTVHFTERFDVQFGGRESHNKQTYDETDTGRLVPAFDGTPSPYVQPTETTSANAFTYLVTPRLRISPDLMVYARFASGYRVGGLNFEAALLNVPEAYKPDRTYNYELGIKGAVWDRRLNFDASAYYINWKDIQINVINPTAYVSYVSNAGGAKSQGVELSVQARPIAALNVTASATFNDAKLTQDFPAPGPGQTAPIGHTGDRLPYSSRFSASLSADDDILHIGGATGFVGATVTYVGDREADFITGIPQRIRFPGYTDLDLRTGARYESWTVNLFLNNACDRRGISGGGVGYSAFPYNAVYIQPRTLGLSIAKSF